MERIKKICRHIEKGLIENFEKMYLRQAQLNASYKY